MISRYHASMVQNALIEEAQRILNHPDYSPENRNLIGGLLVSLATVLESLDSKGMFRNE